MDADLMFFREFNRPHATMEVTVSYFWSGVAMVTLSVLNRKVVEEHFLRNLANVYLRLMYMCSLYVYMYVYMHGFIIQLSIPLEFRAYLK